MRKSVIYALMAIFLVCPVRAMEFMPALDISGALSYPTGVSGDSAELDRKLSAEAALAGSFMVNTDILPQLWFIPTLTMNYSSTAQPLTIDEDRFIFSQWLDIYGSAGFNYELTKNWELRARLLMRIDLAQQTADETLGKGLYDFRDAGFYAETYSRYEGDFETELTVGFKYVDKVFPNYSSLLSEINPDDLGGTLNAAAKNEKNSRAYTVYASADMKLGGSGWYPSLYVSVDINPYRAQQLIKSDGTLAAETRKDGLVTAELSFPYYAGEVTGAAIGYTLSIKSSNQNYYDSMATPDLGDDTFIEDYYSYTGHRISLNVSYETDFNFINTHKPVLSFWLNTEFVGYTNRLSKDGTGKYTDVKQSDFNYDVNAEFRHKLADFWSYYVNFKFARFGSNMKWEAYGTYNYTYVMLSLGTALSF